MKLFQAFVLVVSINNSLVTGIAEEKRKRGGDAIEVKSIPGTSLSTGVYYRGGKKIPEGGILSYALKSNLLQADVNASLAENYKRGKKWYGMDQWMFVEAPDFPGWYELHSRSHPQALATCSSMVTWNGYFLTIATRPEELKRLGVGGDLRESALWQVVSVDDNYFQLKLKRFPQGHVIHVNRLINKDMEYSHFLQVSTRPEQSQRYQKGQDFYDYTLFKFTLSET